MLWTKIDFYKFMNLSLSIILPSLKVFQEKKNLKISFFFQFNYPIKLRKLARPCTCTLESLTMHMKPLSTSPINLSLSLSPSTHMHGALSLG
jgi:hypothetical protein